MHPNTTSSLNSSLGIGERPLIILVAVLAIVLMLPGLFYGLPGGKAITGGLRVLDGEVPYRDFWSMYAPGMFYFQALFFAIIGKTIVPQAVAVILIRAMGAVLVFLITRRLGMARVPAIAIAVVVVVMQWQNQCICYFLSLLSISTLGLPSPQR